MPFHLMPGSASSGSNDEGGHYQTKKNSYGGRRASESAAAISSLQPSTSTTGTSNSAAANARSSGIKEMLQSSLTGTSSNTGGQQQQQPQVPPAIVINEPSTRARSSSLTAIKKHLSISSVTPFTNNTSSSSSASSHANANSQRHHSIASGAISTHRQSLSSTRNYESANAASAGRRFSIGSNDYLVASTSRGRSTSNDLYPSTSNISMAPTDVASIMSSSNLNSAANHKQAKNLMSYLQTQGLSEPFRLDLGAGISHQGRQPNKLYHSRRDIHKDLAVHLSHNGNMLLLPYVSSKKFARTASEEANDDGDDDDEEEVEDDYNEQNSADSSERRSSSTTGMNGHAGTNSRNGGGGGPNTSNKINHTFAVVVALSQKQTLNPVMKAKFSSFCSVEWVNGIPDSNDPKKTIYNETYRVAKDLVWDLNFDHPDCFIPFEDSTAVKNDDLDSVDENDDDQDLDFMEDSSEPTSATSGTASSSSGNPNNNKKNMDPNDVVIVSDTPSQSLKQLETCGHKDRASMNVSNWDATYEYALPPINGLSGKEFAAGYYVYLLPVLFPPTMPESISSPLGSVSHFLSVKTQPIPNLDLKPPQAAAFSTSPSPAAAKNILGLQPIVSPTSTSMSRHRSASFSASPPAPHHRHSIAHSPPPAAGGRSGMSPLRSGGTKLLKSFKGSVSGASGGIGPSNTGKFGGVGGNNFDMSSQRNDNCREYEFELPVIRQPPPDSLTTINKSVYVNKVWNESLNYEITFPKKFVSMSSFDDDMIANFDLKIKLMPLIKRIYMKRIRVNMIEKITYASKNLKYEFDFGKEFAIDKGIKERIIQLFEIKTKEKSHSKSSALRSEVVKNCLDDNLLSTCYENYKPTKSKNGILEVEDDEDQVITNTVKITCPLAFYVKDDEITRTVRTSIVGGSIVAANVDGTTDMADDSASITSVESNSGNGHHSHAASSAGSNLKSLLSRSPLGSSTSLNNHSSSTYQSNSAVGNGSMKDKYGLYPDVSGFGNISIKHRLQICFRISKQELPENLKPGDDPRKLHHYEVIIDTPVVLNAPFANDQTPPSYEDVLLTNEEPDTHNFEIRPVYDNDDEDVDYATTPPPPPFEFAVGSPINNGMNMQSDWNSNDEAVSPMSPYATGQNAPGGEISQLNISSMNNNNNSNRSRAASLSMATPRTPSVSSRSRHASVSGPSSNSMAVSSTIDELLVAAPAPAVPVTATATTAEEPAAPSSHQSNLSKLLSSSQHPSTVSEEADDNIDESGSSTASSNLPLPTSPPKYSQVDHTVNAQHDDAEEFDIGGENYVNPDETLQQSQEQYNKRRIELAKQKNHVLMKKVEDDLADFSF